MKNSSQASAAAKPTQRQMQAMQTKQKIYDAAVREINIKGFHNVSIEDITAAAHVAKGSFYTHFPSKEALVLYTFTQSDALYNEAYEKVKEMDFLSGVTAFVRLTYQEYEKRGKGIIRAMISNYFTWEDRNFYDRDRPLLQCLKKLVERGQDANVLDTGIAAERYVFDLLSTMIGVEVLWCFDTQNLSLTEMISDAVAMTARGMLIQA